MFDEAARERVEREAPLAARMRPRSFDEYVGQRSFFGLWRLGLDSQARLRFAQTSCAHEALKLHLGLGCDHPQRVAAFVQSRLYQLDGLNDGDGAEAGGRTLTPEVREPPLNLHAHGWMHNSFQTIQCLRVGKNPRAELAPVYLAIGAQDVGPELGDDGSMDRRALTLQVTHERVGVNDLRAQCAQYLPGQAFAGGNVAGEADQVNHPATSDHSAIRSYS
jgi:hypothetical protein